MSKVSFEIYHGSHHPFIDFDMSNIGTGEGVHSEGIGMCLTSEIGYAKRSALTAAKNNEIPGWNNYVYEVRVVVDIVKYWDTDLAYHKLPEGVRKKIVFIKELFRESTWIRDVKCLNGEIKKINIPTIDFDKILLRHINNKSEDLYNMLLNCLGKWELYYLLQDIGIDLVKLQSHKFVAINPSILYPHTRHYLDRNSTPISAPFDITNGEPVCLKIEV